MSARQRRDYHLAQFKQAAEEMDPAIKDWKVVFGSDSIEGCPILIVAFSIADSRHVDGSYEKVGS